MCAWRVLVLWLTYTANQTSCADKAPGVAFTERLQALAHDVREHALSQQHIDDSDHHAVRKSPEQQISLVDSRRHGLQHQKLGFLGRSSKHLKSKNMLGSSSNSSVGKAVKLSNVKPRGAQQEAEKLDPTKEMAGVAVFALCVLGLSAWFFGILMDLREHFDKAKQNIEDLDWEFGDYVRYVFGYWLSSAGKRSNASLIVLILTAVVVMLMGTLLYWRAVPNASIWHGARMVFIWLTAPDGGIGEHTLGGAFVGATMSLCGLLVFALLLTLLSDLFQGYMERLRDGNDPVMEVGHIVIIGLTPKKVQLITELCAAHKVTGGTSIVILLGGIAKSEMQDIIDEANVELYGSKIIFRAGHPQYEADLARVGANACKNVIIIADHRKDKEVRDAFVLQALLVLRSNGWPREGHILLECSLLRNRPSLEKIGGSQTDIIMTERWISRLLLQVSQQDGLGVIVDETFSFKGATLYIHPLPPHLIGKEFSELAWHYQDAIPIGTISKNGNKCLLGNCHDRKTFTGGQEIIFLSHDAAGAANASEQKFCEPQTPRSAERHLKAAKRAVTPRLRGDEPEIIILVGWSLLIGPLLVQMDTELHAGTRVICMSPMPLEEREEIVRRAERRWQHPLEKIKLEHVYGMLGSPTVWDRLPMPLEEASRIFILADSQADDTRHADACTVAAVVQVRHMLAEKNITKYIPIVPEVQDPRTEKLCEICNISSYVDSSGMPVQVLATVALEPRLRPALRDLAGDDGNVGYSIRSLQDYLVPGSKLPERVTFMQLHALICQTEDILIGWSWPQDRGRETEFSAAMEAYEGVCSVLKWDLNPANKTTERVWTSSDRLCILGPH